MLFNFALLNNCALIYTQWFIDVLFITHDSRTSNKLCGRKTTKQNILALQKYSLLLSFCHPERSPSYPGVVEFAIAEMACVSRNVRRTFHVPSGVPVQRSISGRDGSYPAVELGKAETASTSRSRPQNVSRSLRRSGPVFRF